VLKLAGAQLVPLQLDDDGLDVDALEALLEQRTVRAVFLTPHHQFPTASVMSARRRARLAELALRHRFAIIEDDYDHEFHYAGKPVLPIAAGSGCANTVYVGSLANLLAPGISTGFVVAPPPVFERLRSLREASDARSDVAMECALAELFEDGELLRHHHLGSALAFRVPDGGLALWARADDSIDVPAWQLAGEREGVLFNSAQRYDFAQREQQCMRLAFSYLDEAELTEAVRRMARALTRARTSQLPINPRMPAGDLLREHVRNPRQSPGAATQ
jgi:GntR family transcriptional regulator / MocR family aminotransferase